MQTRTLASNSTFTTEGTKFDVWGTYHANNGNYPVHTLFDQTTITRTKGEWTYDNLQYWFPGFIYNFRALYPSDIDADLIVTDEKDNKTCHLDIKGFDISQGADLLAATHTEECKSGVKPGTVNFTFRHLLARVAFIGKSDPTLLGDGRQIVIEEAVLSGVYKTGNWSGATFDENTSGNWTPTGAPQDYTVTDITLDTDGTSLFTDELFIPQDLANAKLTIKFHYNVENGTAKTFTSTTELSSLLPRWEAGKSYRYPFAIGSHIFFAKPTIDQWVYAPINNPNDFNIYPN